MAGELLLPWDFQPQEPVEIHGEWRPSAVWLPSLGTQLLIPAGRAASNSNGQRSPTMHGLAYTHDGSSQYENWQLPSDISSARPVVIAASFIVTETTTAVQTAFGLGGSVTTSGLYSGVGQYAAGTVDSWVCTAISDLDFPITGPTAVVGNRYNVIRISRGPFEADMMFVNGVAYVGSTTGTKHVNGAWRNVSAGACVRDTTPIFWGKQTTLLGFVGFTDPGDAWMQAWSTNPWRIFNLRSIPISGTRRVAKRKTFNLSVPHEPPPNSLAEVDPSVAYAFNAGSGMLDLANNAPNWAGSSKISHYKDGLYLDGNMNTSHRRYSSFDNRSAFIIAGRSIRDNSYSSNASQVSAVGSYGWQLKLIDYSTAIRIDFNGYWSASPCFIAYVWDNGWPGLKALNWAMAIDIPNLTYNIYLEGKSVASGVLTQVPDPVQDSGFVSIASVPNQGNVISQLCIIPGSDLVKAQELSKGVNQLFKSMEIPYASPQITTRREVSEMEVPWNEQPQTQVGLARELGISDETSLGLVPIGATGTLQAGYAPTGVATLPSPVLSRLGRGLQFSGAQSVARYTNRIAIVVDDYAMLVVVRRGALTGTRQVILSTSNLSGSVYRTIEFAAANTVSAVFRDSDTTRQLDGTATFGAGDVVTAVLVSRSDTVKALFINGYLADGTLGTDKTGGGMYLVLGAVGVTTSQIGWLNGEIYLAALLPNVSHLSDAYFRDLSANPWWLFAPRSIPFDQPALVRQLDPLTPTDGMTPRIYLGS